MSQFIDRTNQPYGRLTARWVAGRNKAGVQWLCSCECGNTVVVGSSSLGDRNTQSCGCLQRETTSQKNTTHGLCGTLEYRLFKGAAHRAKEDQLPFDLDVTDIVIPNVCPLLKIPLLKTNTEGGPFMNSPSLDKIIPKLGYVKGNIQVVSFKANTMKSNATLEEIELLAKNWREQTHAR